MSISVMAFSANKESDEYKVAIKLKRNITIGISSIAIGEIVLFANAALFEQLLKDDDLLVIGKIKSGYTVARDFNVTDSMIHDRVAVWSS